MIERLWYAKSPLYYVLWPCLKPLSLLYQFISSRRKRAYQQSAKAGTDKQTTRVGVPVIIVGNITAGGNGKTPVVIWLIELLKKQGYRPGVVSRGYGGKADSYPLLVTDSMTSYASGDEPKLIATRTGVPVVVDPKRTAAAKALLASGVDIIVADDGLQHYALERDIEFSVVDGVRRYGNEQIIPLGPLREPLSRLKEVDFIITNGGKALENEIQMNLVPLNAINLVTNEQRPVSELTNAVAIAGIGHPPRFFNTLHSLGANVVATHAFSDHQHFKEAELHALARKGDHLVMTEKDAVKCMKFAQSNWWYLPVNANIDVSNEQTVLEKIKEVSKQYGS
ncbi:tetraacyldisaccharide 4'-kinase [Vibrio sp.]|nr:tetraacyldisaccharide 4'-kinase [Vibrio sp.]